MPRSMTTLVEGGLPARWDLPRPPPPTVPRRPGELSDADRRSSHGRANRILELITARPGRTIFDIAVEFFNGLESFHVVLGISEVAAHIDLLEQRGQVTSSGSPQRFEATRPH